MSDKESDHGDAESQDLSCPDVITKYRHAGDIANKALQTVIANCKADADTVELCKIGDNVIVEETSKIYNKKEKGRKVEKGIAFPTCVAVNEICGYFSPLENESEKIKEGDLVKVELGCHIDGYICVVGHSIVVGSEPISGRKADVLKAAWTAAEAVTRSVKVGQTNNHVTKIIEDVAKQFKCNPVHGVVSHQIKRHIIDGNECIANSDQMEDKVEEFKFGVNEVYGIDIVMSSGEGKVREADKRATVFKRAVQMTYQLKTPLARAFLSDVNRRFPTLPFTIRSMEDERAMLVGVTECMRHELLQCYRVQTERPGEFVAQFKFTLLLLPGGSKKITGLPFCQEGSVVSEYQLEDETLKKLLACSINPKKKKKKAPSKTSATKSEEDGEGEGEGDGEVDN